MLKPKYLEQLPKPLIEIYSAVEIRIIKHMAEIIAAQKEFIPSVQWQYKKLIEMGNFHSWIIEAHSAELGLAKQEIERIMIESGQKALKFDTDIYRKAGLAPPTLAESVTLQSVLKSGIENTNGLFENLTRTTANTATRQLETALDRVWLETSSGAFDYTTSISHAIEELTSKGIKAITYQSGHSDYLDVAVRRAAVTGVNQTAAKMQETLADELDSDLVETTAHSGARNEGIGPMNHASWQGKVFSRSGTSKKYPSFRETTGYGTGAGLCGYNCRHSFYPYFEGMDPVYTQKELDDMNAKNIEFKGKTYTEYEMTQHQRYIERGIRKSKRHVAGLEAAGLPAEKARAGLASWLDKQDEFISLTGFKRQYTREKVLDNFGKSGIINTGAISGALNPDSQKAYEHAEQYYNSVRAMKSDTAKIAKNTGFKQSNIDKVKNHLFINEHDLGDGLYSRFFPDYEIAQSWQRLIDGKDIKPHDYVLLKHETAEATLMKRGLKQQQAHDKANKRYNYQNALNER